MIEDSPYGYYPGFPYKNRYGKYNYMGMQGRIPRYRQNVYQEKGDSGNLRTKYIYKDKSENKKKENKVTETKNKKAKIDESYSPIFEIFGIKLYFDDILLIALIFFLYDEGVQDNMLFIALVLLLLS